MMDERFARGDSLLHKLNPGVKIFCTFLFTLVVALTSQFTVACTALLFSFLALSIARFPFIEVVKRLLLVNSFTFLLWLTLPLTYGGAHTVSWGGVTLSVDGFFLVLLITLKTNAIIMWFMAHISSSTVASLGHGLERLGVPERLCFLLLFSYRFIFVIHQEFMRLHRAAVIRNFKPGTSLHTYRTFGYLFGMTLVKSYNRSQRVHQAMLLRGFEGKLTPLTQHRIQRLDLAFLLVQSISIFSLTLLNFY